MTTAHTHVITEFASPYIRCEECFQYVTGYVSYQNNPPECEHKGQNHPCGHDAGVEIECDTWSPVDGCQCVLQLGRREHPLKREKEQPYSD